MTFAAYVQRQKSLIRSRRTQCAEVGAAVSRAIGQTAEEGDKTEKLLRELSSLKGLNTAERMAYFALRR